MKAPGHSRRGSELLALEAWGAFQSRGLPVVPDGDPRLEPMRAAGARLRRERMGQLDFSCAVP